MFASGAGFSFTKTVVSAMHPLPSVVVSIKYPQKLIVTFCDELKTLPVGSSALDFAFDIHTDIGAKCIGAKVNQKLVPINHVLT